MRASWNARTSFPTEGLLCPSNHGRAASTLLCFAAVCRLRSRLGTNASARAIRYKAGKDVFDLLQVRKLSRVAYVGSDIVFCDSSFVEKVERVFNYSHTFV